MEKGRTGILSSNSMRDGGMRRVKREEYKRITDDRSFSDWKILIGHSDWEEYSNGKEGCLKYRIDNLPKELSPGVYELGIRRSPSHQILPVYLGHADNVRARLQSYGRNGAHLHPHLFQQLFSLRLSILYRWAPMQTKQDARQAETRLLTTFDYAWNTSSNGVRRADDIIRQISRRLDRALLLFTHNQLGIPIQSIKPQPYDTNNFQSQIFAFTTSRPRLLQHTTPLIQEHLNDQICGMSLPYASICTTQPQPYDTNNFLSRIFAFTTSRPRLLQHTTALIQEQLNDQICGMPLPDASICTAQPLQGRKRCHQHKGMKIPTSMQTKANTYTYQNGVQDPPKTPLDESITNTDICGFILTDGSACTRQPVQGNKRCHQHKGMRIPASIQTKDNTYRYQNVNPGVQYPPQTPVYESITNTDICGFILTDGSTCTRQPVEGRKRCHQHKGMRIPASIQTEANTYRYQNVNHGVQHPPQTPVYESITNSDICGFILSDGSTCTRQPVEGRKRCHQHKGMRIPASIQTEANTCRYQNVNHGLQYPPQTPVYESITYTNICGFILINGSTCTRQPVEGRKRCHQHKGMRIPASIQTEANTYRYQNVNHGVQYPPQTPVYESISYTNICGIILTNGSTCTRQPVEGRKRCHQHKGRRIPASFHHY